MTVPEVQDTTSQPSDLREGHLRHFAYKNIANFVSIIGVIPLCILLREGGYQYLVPLIIYNNVMDDLDGILAAKLDIRSEFGAILDNVCDSIAHSIIVMAVGMHFGGVCAVASLIGVTAMVWRGVARLDPAQINGVGSPTNELIRHVFFILVLAQILNFNAAPYLVATFLVHSVSMLVPYRMPYMIRSLTKSAAAIGLVNATLVVAWLIPLTAPVIASCFMISYLYALLTPLIRK
jgi:phosphatidylglycerophosphate synthase